MSDNQENFLITDSFYCAVRYFLYNMAYGAIICMPIMFVVTIYAYEIGYYLNDNIDFAKCLYRYVSVEFIAWIGLLGYFACMFFLGYLSHAFALNKALKHEYKRFRFVKPFTKIRFWQYVVSYVGIMLLLFMLLRESWDPYIFMIKVIGGSFFIFCIVLWFLVRRHTKIVRIS